MQPYLLTPFSLKFSRILTRPDSCNAPVLRKEMVNLIYSFQSFSSDSSIILADLINHPPFLCFYSSSIYICLYHLRPLNSHSYLFQCFCKPTGGSNFIISIILSQHGVSSSYTTRKIKLIVRKPRVCKKMMPKVF